MTNADAIRIAIDYLNRGSFCAIDIAGATARFVNATELAAKIADDTSLPFEEKQTLLNRSNRDHWLVHVPFARNKYVVEVPDRFILSIYTDTGEIELHMTL